MLTLRESFVPERGEILDRNGNVLAGPGNDYSIGLDLPWIARTDHPDYSYAQAAGELATDLAPILDRPRYELLDMMYYDQLYVHLENREPPEVAAALEALPYSGIAIHPVARRLYPQGNLACHVLGYVDFDGNGGSGLEGAYNMQLAGEAVTREFFNIPSTPRTDLHAREGLDLVLTLDRTVQQTVERHLAEALATYDAEGGTIIAMDPRTGAILAMANYPCFSPYDYSKEPEELLLNPAISSQYEPGSVFKLITMSAGIDSGAITPDSVYNDNGLFVLGGHIIKNAEDKAYGSINMLYALKWSVNTATTWVATLTGPDTFYGYLERFGFGRPTGIDLAAEAYGQMTKNTDDGWSEGMLGTNAFGQGIGVTPLQMISAVSAIANDGKQMRPYLVQAMYRDGELFAEHQPQPASIPITAETAAQVTAMAIESGQQYAAIEGYTMAGKSGTAQIPEGGFYHPDDVIASFVGWVPADDPQLLMLVKLDRPHAVEWGSESAAPTWKKLAEELVVLLDIPPDRVRFAQTQP
jgi:cell division protein FtsI/penicillin-binding protein 2